MLNVALKYEIIQRPSVKVISMEIFKKNFILQTGAFRVDRLYVQTKYRKSSIHRYKWNKCVRKDPEYPGHK